MLLYFIHDPVKILNILAAAFLEIIQCRGGRIFQYSRAFNISGST